VSQAVPRKLPPYVVKERSRHGRVMFFFRRGKGPRVRLPDDTQSQAFKDAYEAALTGKAARTERKAQVPSDTLEWLVDRYMESGRWAALSPATRKQQGLFFKDTLKRSGNPPYAAITRRTIHASMDARKDTPALANNWLKAMRGLFQWAVRNEHIDADPTQGVDRIRYKSDGFKVWTAGDVQAFCERWPLGTKPYLAFSLFLVSGLRRGDMHRLGPQHLRGNVLSIRANKNAAPITIELPPFALEAIAATPTGDMAFMTKGSGEPFTSKESFGNWFSARCRDAGLNKGKSAHGLRKLAATMAADAGGTTHELMAHFGWSTPAQAEVYTRGADRARLGTQSSRRLAGEIENITARTTKLGSGSGVKQ
jgi:integrase